MNVVFFFSLLLLVWGFAKWQGTRDGARLGLLETASLELDAHLRRDGSLAWTHPSHSEHLALQESERPTGRKTVYTVELSVPLSARQGIAKGPLIAETPLELDALLHDIDALWSSGPLDFHAEHAVLQIQKKGWPADVTTLKAFKKKCDALLPYMRSL